MWFPVLNRLPGLPQMGYPGRMLYLFLQSVVPTVPASFLTFATGVIYKVYEEAPRAFSMTAVEDQQLAGAIMKVYGGLVLWMVILVMFFRYYAESQHKTAPEETVLTWDEVQTRARAQPGAHRAVRRLAAAALLVSVAVTGCNSNEGALDCTKPAAVVGCRAPTFTTTDLDGKPVRLVAYRGQSVVVNFWASWCVPCRKEFPLLAELDARDDVAVLGVVFNDTPGNARKFMTELDASWPGLNDDGSIAKAYRVGPGIPASIVVDSAGVVTKRHIGEFSSVDELL